MARVRQELAQGDVAFCSRQARAAQRALISAVRLAQTVLHGPSRLTTIPRSEASGPIITTSTAPILAVVRTRTGWRTIAVTRRWAVAITWGRRECVLHSPS